VNYESLLRLARSELTDQPQARLEAEVLLCHVLGITRAGLYARMNSSPDPEQRHRFMELVRKRAEGEPIAYLTGIREFWSLPLRITPDVLIPRPETELLVEIALSKIPVYAEWRIADLGTGSGAIALALALERQHCEIHATELSVPALDLARSNARDLRVTNVGFYQGSWLEPLSGHFHGIVSNPPYISSSDPHIREGDCRFEPESALTPGPDGLESIRCIAAGSLNVLHRKGFLAFEHGHDQGAASRELLRELGYSEVKTFADLAGLERVTLAIAG